MSDRIIAITNRILNQIANILTSIGTSTAPVPVTATIKNGNYAFVALGAPSIAANAPPNTIVYSTPIAPNGEKLSFSFQMFTTGDRAPGNDAYIFLEYRTCG